MGDSPSSAGERDPGQLTRLGSTPHQERQTDLDQDCGQAFQRRHRHRGERQALKPGAQLLNSFGIKAGAEMRILSKIEHEAH